MCCKLQNIVNIAKQIRKKIEKLIYYLKKYVILAVSLCQYNQK